MKLSAMALTLSQAVLLPVAVAHGPTPQKIDESIVISAPVEAVWEQVADFSKMADWHPMVSTVTMTDDTTRVIEIKDKGKLTESLDELDADNHYMSYRLYEEDITVFPTSFYTVTIEIKPSDAGANMNWSGRFYRADTGNFPPAEYSDEAAVKAMKEFATSGMASLKTLVEAK
jgi:carbon monoxide dehydrogenase subunit G